MFSHSTPIIPRGSFQVACEKNFWIIWGRGSFRVVFRSILEIISGRGYIYIYVVVQFYPWFKFYFPLFLGMLMYDNEFETKENKI